MGIELPSGYWVRTPDQGDCNAVTEIVVAGDIADFGEPDFTVGDLLDDWSRPRFDLTRDAWVLSGPTGRIVGYGYVWESQPGSELEADAYVLPEYAGRGLGGALLDLIEQRGGEIACEAAGDVPMELGVFASRVNGAKQDLLRKRGFMHRNTTLRLKVDLARKPVEEIEIPDTVVLRGYRAPDDEAAVHDTMTEAFAAHYRYTPRRLDEWLDLRQRHPDFDPDLWRVAEHDGEIVGAILVYDVGGTGYVSNVGVRKVWRGQGIGQALLRDAFAALRERGQMRVLVSLDADAAPEAIRMYEMAGMAVHEQHDRYVKPLNL